MKFDKIMKGIYFTAEQIKKIEAKQKKRAEKEKKHVSFSETVAKIVDESK
jgi:hypothetical protein